MTDSVNRLAFRETRREIEGAGVVINDLAARRNVDGKGELFHFVLVRVHSRYPRKRMGLRDPTGFAQRVVGRLIRRPNEARLIMMVW